MGAQDKVGAGFTKLNGSCEATLALHNPLVA
jgi:hypothetical protein